MKNIYIVAAVRTPMGSFMGSLAQVPATDLGACAIAKAIENAKISPNEINEVIMGQVLQANAGQSPATQASIKAGLSDTIPTTTVNKVCASGMKAIAQAAQAIKAGDAQVVVAGGMENMSQAPYYSANIRQGNKLGNINLIDGLVKDGLTDVYSQQHMGACAELCAEKYNISREAQDAFAISSYQKAAQAWADGKFDAEIAPVSIPQRKGEPVIFDHDEEYKAVKFDKIPQLPTVFKKDGTITPANASTLNDGASALVLVSEEKLKELNLKPLARIVAYADAAHDPTFFTTAPAKALPLALQKANLSLDEIDFFEFNEAFSVVGLANNQILGLDPNKVNIHGGAVALGHPLGSSGSRIVVSLVHILEQNKAKYGAAAICNGGGGASAMIIENLQ
jgi:acetyl-CoA C-acetyltransferase